MSMPSLKFKRPLITIENKRNEHSQVAELVDAIILYSYCDEWDKFKEM